MISTNAEYEYFKEFIDFSVNDNYSPLPIHYNGKYEEEQWAYYDKLTELSLKLKIEIETNLIYLSPSKIKCKLYLNKVLIKLLALSDKLDWYQDEATEMVVVVGKDEPLFFLEVLWTRHWNLLEDLIKYCRIELSNQKQSKLSLSGRKSIETDKIIWIAEPHKLKQLYTSLISESSTKKVFILNTGYREFETHFTTETDASKKPINWVREKYILTYLFDKLCKHKLIHSDFKSNCDVLLSSNFLVKGKSTTTSQLSSARDSFVNGQTKITIKSKKKQETLLFLDNVLKRLINKQTSEKEVEDIRINAHSARNRF